MHVSNRIFKSVQKQITWFIELPVWDSRLNIFDTCDHVFKSIISVAIHRHKNRLHRLVFNTGQFYCGEQDKQNMISRNQVRTVLY